MLLYQALGVEWAIELESANGPLPRLMKALTGVAGVVVAGVETADGAGAGVAAGVDEVAAGVDEGAAEVVWAEVVEGV